jgi:nucleoside-diphosphate-sugar epimerase
VYGWKRIGEITREVLGRKALTLRIPEVGVYAIATIAEGLAFFSPQPALINLEKAKDMVQDYWTCSSAKASAHFGYEEQLSIEEGLRNTVQWYRDHGWLKP